MCSYICDKKCPVFNGYSIRAHVIAATKNNGDLKSFLDCITCRPNMTAIANTGMPAGSSRKCGKAKCERSRSSIPIESRSTHPCLLQSSPGATQLTSSLDQSSPSTDQPYPRSSAIPAPINKSHLYTASTHSTSSATDKTQTSSSGVPEFQIQLFLQVASTCRWKWKYV